MSELKKTVLFCAFFCQKHVIFPLFKTFFFKTRSFFALFCHFFSFLKPPPPFLAQKQAPLKTPHTKPPPFSAQKQASQKQSIHKNTTLHTKIHLFGQIILTFHAF